MFSGDHEIRCVKRKLLLESLASELPSGTIRFSSKVVSIEESGYFKLVHLADGTILKAKVTSLYFLFITIFAVLKLTPWLLCIDALRSNPNSINLLHSQMWQLVLRFSHLTSWAFLLYQSNQKHICKKIPVMTSFDWHTISIWSRKSWNMNTLSSQNQA